MKAFKNKYGDYALITGASSGIGAEFARQLAAMGFNLVLVARRVSRLDELAATISRQYRVDVKTIGLDLLDERAVETIVAATKNIQIGLLIPNAGLEVHGDFVSNSYEMESNTIKLNALVPMQLAHIFGGKMAERRKGGIIFVSSTFGHQSVPYFANYSASKAYVLSIGQALNYELKKKGVDVTVLSPGLTKTEMTQGMKGMDFSKMPIIEMGVEPVVRKALHALGRKQAVIPGKWNNMMDIMGKFTTPRWMLTNMFGFLVSRAMTRPAQAVKAVKQPAGLR